ncbi:MAG: PA14 domain-containing protein, partial [Luteolibacter sp.]
MSDSLINGVGSYNGFSVQFDDSSLSLDGGEIGISDLVLNGLSVLRAGQSGNTGATAVYAKIYTSQDPSTSTWVGDSLNTVNLTGGISDLVVGFQFDGLALSSATRYYIYFADESGNLEPNSIRWRRGRLRVSNQGGITYPSGNLINSTNWSNVDTAYDLVFTANIGVRSYTAPASTEQPLLLPGEGTYALSLAVSDGTHSVEEPIRLVVEAPPAEPDPMTITAQPVDVTAALGDSIELSIATTGPTPAIYQWRRNGRPVGQASASPTLSMVNISGGAAGVYDCVYTTDQGVLVSATATVTVSDAGETVSGGLWREAYTGIGGSVVSDLTAASKFPLFADASGVITSAAAPSNYADNYGQRWTGWLVPTVTGRYRFYLSHDDGAELWLGADQSPESASRILAYSGATGEKQWSSRTPSAWVDLVAGQEYYFELLQKEGGGADHCAVAWQLDGDPAPTNGSGEIPGEFFKYQVGGVFSEEILNNAAPVFSQDSYLMPQGSVAVPYTSSVAGYAVNLDETWDEVTYSLVSGPSWLAVASDGSLSGTAGGGSIGDNRFVIRATDRRGLSSTATIIIPMSEGELMTGGLWRDVYTGIGGDAVSNLTDAAKFPLNPDSIGAISSAAAPSNAGSNYGQRWTGWLTPEATGRYRFYLASDDSSQLFLGTTDQAESAVSILTLSGYTDAKQWSARSPSEWIELVAGQRYYIELLHKEGGGGDHCALAWQIEGGATPSNGSGEIPGQFLSYRAGGIFSDQILNNQPPEFTQSAFELAAADALIPYTGSLAGFASDPDSDWDVVSYSLVSGPSWLSVAADGSLSGTPGVNVVGINSFTIRATDKRGLSDTATIAIEVLAADYYYDINGTLAGSGAAAGGSWGDTAIWALDPDGQSETVPWIDGATAVFSAGGDATGSYPINLSGEKILGGFIVRTGLPQLIGGQITLEYGDTSFEIDSSGARIDSVLAGSDRGLVKSGMGTLVLGGSNTFTGNLRIFEGVLELSSSGKLYNGGYTNTAVITVETDGIWRLPDYSYPGVGQLADYRQRRVIDGGTIEVTGPSHSSGQDFTVTANGGVFRYTASGQTLSFTGNNNTDIRLDGPTEFETIGEIRFDGATALLEGSGSIRKTGSGRLVIANNQSYSAPVTLVEGELVVLGSIGSPISIADGARLSGSGLLGGS